MSTGLRRPLLIGRVASLVGSVPLVCLRGLATLGWKCWELPDLLGQLNEERQRGAELDRQWDRANRRVVVKNQVVVELVARRLSLVEAATRFRDLEETPGDTLNRLSRSADGERFCREVIAWVDGQLRCVDPDLADEMAA